MYRFLFRDIRMRMMDLQGRCLIPVHRWVSRRPTRSVPVSPKVLILGWYGTETCGDRAILTECCRLLDDAFPSPTYRLITTDRERTQETMRVIHLQASLVSMSIMDWWRHIQWADVVVIAGGPLMDDPAILKWWVRMLLARFLGKPSILLGVGVRPLRFPGARRAVRCIAELSSLAILRETPGPGLALGHHSVLIDPALYGPVPQRPNRSASTALRMAVNLRPWPISFFGGSWAEYSRIWSGFKDGVLATLADLVQDGTITDITFFAMHDMPLDDDRDLYDDIRRSLVERGVDDSRIAFVEEVLSPLDTVQLISRHELFMGMRFHANLFSALAGTPGIGIDYDSEGGKVSYLYEALGRADSCLCIQLFTPKWLRFQVLQILENWDGAHQEVAKGRNRLRQTREEALQCLKPLQRL